ncbi:hypothetical protein KEM55_008205 [Ascosphaera atra]|nr:hypothetical protein KEM55_008205 [Ascosphaera atra]
MSRRGSSEMLSSDEEDVRERNAKFAPPPGLNFAPPPNLNDIPRSPEPRPPSQPQESQPPPPPSAAPLSDDKSGDDAFARRLRMSGAAPPSDFINTPPPPEPIPGPLPPPAPAAAAAPTPATLPVPQSHEQQVYESATISRPPVRYELPAAPEDIPATEAELEAAFADEREAEAGAEPEADPNAPRSLRPGQKGFAERLLAKYGWTKGSGLGANEGGIVNPLQVKVEKAKKRPDSEGGGYVGPKATKAKIVGGKKKGGQEETGKFGAMSDVVVLKGMVDGMDVEKEMAGGEEGGPGLMQEIGEECSSKYGRVERVYIDRNTSQSSIPVFVKFTSQLSALRAVNALEGRVFNGNTITARFYNSDKFEQGVYE